MTTAKDQARALAEECANHITFKGKNFLFQEDRDKAVKIILSTLQLEKLIGDKERTITTLRQYFVCMRDGECFGCQAILKELLESLENGLAVAAEPQDGLREQIIQTLIDHANWAADCMEGEGMPGFKIYEDIMCWSVDELKKYGVKYNPMTGIRIAIESK